MNKVKNINFGILHLMLCTVMLLLPAIASAIEAPVWTTESYRAYAYTAYIDGSDAQSNEAFGPPLPVSASQSMGITSANSYIDSTYMTVFATSGSTSEKSNAIAEFTGSYTAADPYFIFSYSFRDILDWSTASGWITITDTDSSTVLYDYAFTDRDTGTISVDTPYGHNIEVNFGTSAYAHPFDSIEDGRLDYAMAVAPEPMSMILFTTGGLMLAGRRILKKQQQC